MSTLLVDSAAVEQSLLPDSLRLVRFVAPHYEAARPVPLLDLTTAERKLSEGGGVSLSPAERDRGNIRLDVPWAGELPSIDRHGNARLSFTLRLLSLDPVADADRVVAAILTAPSRCAIEWRRGGRATYYPLRGDADWTPTYRMRERQQEAGMLVAFGVEVAPYAHHGSMDVVDDFAVDSLSDYAFDVGEGTVAVLNGSFVPSDVTEKRLHHTARGFAYGDAQATVKATMGASAASGSGVILKRLGPDDYLRVALDGAGIAIHAVNGGAVTLLASVAHARAVSTAYWVRGRTEGNTITAEVFAALPSPLAVPAATVSHTLTGGNVSKFGAGIEGGVGMRLVPAGTDERYDDFTVKPYTYRARLHPEHISLGGRIPGGLPALCDLHVSTAEGGASAPAFGLFAWSSRPVPAVYQAPLGILEGEAAATLTTFAATALAGTHGGSYAGAAPAGAGTALVQWLVDSDALPTDEDGTVSVDVFARVIYDSTRTGLKWVLHADPASGVSRGPRRYGDRGTTGLTAVEVTASSWRFVRLGRIRLGGPQRLGVDVSWSAGSGSIGLDYALVVPSRLLVASPMDVPNDDAYPDFSPNTSAEVTRLLLHDGGAFSQPAGQSPLRDHGMGRRIELPPGNVDLISKLSTLVPGDPTVNAASEQLEHSATIHARVLPRFAYA